jgi:hypothetical protein
MKIISILSSLSSLSSRHTGRYEEQPPAWVRDPLAHPVLDAMSERELADLPFSRGVRPLRTTDACRG